MASSNIFHSLNSQSDGINTLRRIEYEFRGQSYKFALNPEEYTQEEPNRATVTQTKGGGFVDEFGSGIVTIYFKGTTGMKNGGAPSSGFIKFKELRDLIRETYDAVEAGKAVTRDKELVFHNYTDGEHWVVIANTFKLYRSIARPNLYLYEVQMTCVRAASQPGVTISEVGGSVGKVAGLDTVNYDGVWKRG